MTPTYVLFSPIGKTDPVRDCFDGPMLHIVRHYLPEHVTLFLTAEVAENQKKNNWYTDFIRDVSPKTEVVCKNSDIVNAADFEVFFPWFEESIRELAAQYPDATILLNVSSGTPQMISTLCVLASVLPFPIRCIQVLTPQKRSNAKIGYLDENSTWQEVQENNFDQQMETENRCVRLHLTNFVYTQLQQTVSEMLASFDYDSALKLVLQNKPYFSEQFAEALSGAACRKMYNLSESKKHFANAEIEVFEKMNNQALNLYEFYLGMRADLYGGDYIRFFSRLSPFCIGAVSLMLKSNCNFDPDLILTKDRRISNTNLSARYPQLYQYLNGRYLLDKDFKFISLDFTLNIMKYYAQGREGSFVEWADFIELLRKLEINIRNGIAHNLKTVTEKQIEQEAGCSIKEFRQKLDRLVLFCLKDYKVTSAALGAYEKMNEKILQL